MHQYAGQQLTTGPQAEVYADHFIANHLKVIGGGKTYAQLSAESIAQPGNAKLAAQVATVFKGETLRGLLLNAYAFGTMGMIAGIAAIAAYIAGRHARPRGPGPHARPSRLFGHRHPRRPARPHIRAGHRTAGADRLQRKRPGHHRTRQLTGPDPITAVDSCRWVGTPSCPDRKVSRWSTSI